MWDAKSNRIAFGARRSSPAREPRTPSYGRKHSRGYTDDAALRASVHSSSGHELDMCITHQANGKREKTKMNRSRTTKRLTARSRRKRSRRQDKTPMHKQLLELRKRFGILTLKETKRRAIERAVKAAKGDKILAAALLDVGKNTVYRCFS